MTIRDLLLLEKLKLIDEELLDDYWFVLHETEQRLNAEKKLIYFFPKKH